jgi:hypothetical protein
MPPLVCWLKACGVQTNQQASKRRKDKKDKGKNDAVKALLDLLQGKKKRKKKKKRDRKSDRDQDGPSWRLGVKPDPDDSGRSDSSGSSGLSSSRSRKRRHQDSSDEDSELSIEPPLRRRAAKEPGSVMAMLVKNMPKTSWTRAPCWKQKELILQGSLWGWRSPRSSPFS